jgi:serine/threonine-protein kinase
MAPEQIRGDPVDERSDIFSVGTVLYEMATALRAFRQRNIAALVEAVQHSEPPPPTFVNPYVPVALERVITKAMDKEPADRYATAEELAEALEALMPRSGRDRDPHAPPRRWRSLIAMGA